MNKELEALKNIKGTIISSRRGDWKIEYCYVSDIESTKKHFDIIEQALKRNEPMKPMLDENNNHRCARCHHIVDNHYCSDCGGAVDWGKEYD